MSIATEITRLQEAKAAIKTAIEGKGQTVEDTARLSDFAGLIEAISTGSQPGGSDAVPKDIKFYDYDGTLLYAYTLDEAHALTALPDGPAHDGLVFDGWNWTLEKVKSLTKPMNIGAMYSTDDGTTRIYIHLEEGRTSPMLGICPNGTVTVDWGDGTDPDTLAGTSLTTVKWTSTHNYTAPGDYVIRLAVDGTTCILGESNINKYSCILRYSQDADVRNEVYQNAVRKVEVGSGTMSIGNYAFRNCRSLSSITIPNGVTSIGNYTFYDCSSLSSITIPDGVTSINGYAFDNCYSLSSITIPDSITSIGAYAFQYCLSLSSITIPDGVTSISDYAFQYCYSLSSITIPNGVTSIGNYTFYDCYSLSSITIPNGVTNIGNYAFQYCSSLSSITIPDSVKSIGTYAFDGCLSLSSITIPNGVTSISGYAFRNCRSLSSITIPNGVTSIGNYAFQSCYGMKYYDFTSFKTAPTLSNINAFTGISADCEIRVPAALANKWKSVTNWARYASYIVGV